MRSAASSASSGTTWLLGTSGKADVRVTEHLHGHSCGDALL